MIQLYYPDFWQRRGLISYALLPLGIIFILLGFIRKLFATQIRFNAFTLCIGNCTVGGTGKTQLIINLAKEFSDKNINFIILSKGYGGNCSAPALVTSSSSPEEVGDEALELCKYGTSFVVPSMKRAGSIIAKYKPDLILVDDGMQNPHFKKDMVIMTIDGERGFGNGLPIPAGPLRTLKSQAINFADAILVNGTLKRKLPEISTKPIFHAEIYTDHTFADKKYFAFAGIGNPAKFFNMLKEKGASVIETKIFPDHHQYSPSELQNLFRQAQKKKLTLITTRKDYVKIKNMDFDIETGIRPALEYAGMAEKKYDAALPNLEFLEVSMHVKERKDFLNMILCKFEKYMKTKC